MSGHEEIEDPEYVPPTPERVARRALVLAAVSARGLLEQEDASDPGVENTRQRLLTWVEQLGLLDEFEAQELEFLRAPLGAPTPQTIINGTWRIEGLGILAWALRRHEWMPPDVLLDPGVVLPAVSILNVDGGRALLSQPSLRSAEDLDEAAEKLFAQHWRLRQFSLDHAPNDFASLAKTTWFGPLNIEGLRLIENDMAIGDSPIGRAPEDDVRRAQSAVQERHHAINWLMGHSEIYSEVDTST